MSEDHNREVAPSADSFFAGESRRRVMVLGIAMIAAGIGVIALTLSLSKTQDLQQIAWYLIVVGIALVGGGLLCLLKKPSEGSPPGSTRYARLVRRQRAISYSAFIASTTVVAILGTGIAITLLLLGILSAGDAGDRIGSAVTGVLVSAGSIGAGLALRAARQGRLKHIKPPSK